MPSEGYFDGCKKQQLIFDCLCVTSRLIRHVIENGATGIEHEKFDDEQTAKYMAERDIFLPLTPLEKGNPEYNVQSKTRNYNLNEAGSFSLFI